MKLVISESNKKYTATLGNYTTIDNIKQYVWDDDSEKEETPDETSAQDDTDAMLVDHEYRLTMLELGL